jgi:hypothetical protein
LAQDPDADPTKLNRVVSDALCALRSTIEGRSINIIQGMNRKLWANERHVMLFLLSTEVALSKALRDTPPLFLLPLDIIELQYKGFEPHLILARAVVASGQHAAYMIALELPTLRPTKFADTFVVSGTFPLPMNWNRLGIPFDIDSLSKDIAKVGGTSVSAEMVPPSEPVATATDEEIAMGQDFDVILSAFSVHECAFCEKTGCKLRKCACCLVARYCSQDHQAAHWPAHRVQCRKLADWYKLRFTPV